MRRTIFAMAMVALGLLAVFLLASYVPAVPHPHLASIPAEGERTIILELSWGGDIYTSTETSCDIWTGQFECELRRGGSPSGEGIIMTTTLPLTGTVAMVDPPGSGTVVTTTLRWPLTSLPVGAYETWCRLGLTNGEEHIWGYVPGEGQELDGYCHVDTVGIGVPCGVARTFGKVQAWIQ
jgi:hypothetical protein